MSWFSSLVSSVTNSFDGITEDLQAFVSTIKSDTTQVLSKTSQAIIDQQSNDANQSIASKLTDVVEVVKTSINETSSAPERGRTRTTSPKKKSSLQLSKSGSTATLQGIQHNSDTFLVDPLDSKAFQSWLVSFGSQANFKSKNRSATFDVAQYRDSISKLIASDEVIRAFHTDLVPHTVSYHDFWRRYFYRVHIFESNDKRRKAIVDRMQQKQKQEDLEFSDWDDDDEKEDPPSPKSSITSKQPQLAQPNTATTAPFVATIADRLEVSVKGKHSPVSSVGTEYEIDHIFDEINKTTSSEPASEKSSSPSSPKSAPKSSSSSNSLKNLSILTATASPLSACSEPKKETTKKPANTEAEIEKSPTDSQMDCSEPVPSATEESLINENSSASTSTAIVSISIVEDSTVEPDRAETPVDVEQATKSDTSLDAPEEVAPPKATEQLADQVVSDHKKATTSIAPHEEGEDDWGDWE